MVDFNKYRCRNCLHFHHWYNNGKLVDICNLPIGVSWKVDNENEAMAELCSCNNFESNDNLTFLQQRYEKKGK